MKKILYILIIISFAACNNKKVEKTQGYVATPNGLADLQKPTTTPSTTPTVQSNLLTNPPHGEPGHDCSIAVGAPLKAGARTSTTAAQQAQPIATQTTAQQAPTVQANANSGKLNPAHGQPGHDCAIAVGAPLNSKTVQTTTPPKINIAQPATTNSTQVPVLNEKGQRLNPAHGQPGHKCEVAVGAPLT